MNYYKASLRRMPATYAGIQAETPVTLVLKKSYKPSSASYKHAWTCTHALDPELAWGLKLAACSFGVQVSDTRNDAMKPRSWKNIYCGVHRDL